MSVKTAFIGPAQLYNVLQSNKPEWDFQIPLETLNKFENQINSENSEIDPDTSVIVFFSRLYNQNPELFADLVSITAPNAVTCIIIPNADRRDYENQIKNSVKTKMEQYAMTDDSYNSNTPYYFISYESDDVYEDIDNAILDFYNSPLIDNDIKAAIKNILPYDTTTNSHNNNFENDYEEPEKHSFDFDDVEGKGKVIVSTSSKGGPGKSTVAMSCGNALVRASINAVHKGLRDTPLKVIVVDFDVKDGQLGFINGVVKPNIVNIYADYADDSHLTQSEVEKGIYHNKKTNVDYLFASKKPRNANVIPKEFYYEVVKVLKTMYDYIILDTSVGYLDPLLTEVAYPFADKVIFVTDMGTSSVFGMTRWIAETIAATDKEHTVDKDIVGVVINKAIPNAGIDMETIIESAKGLPIITAIPNVPTLVTSSTNKAQLEDILEHQGIKDSFEDILDFILDENEIVSEL